MYPPTSRTGQLVYDIPKTTARRWCYHSGSSVTIRYFVFAGRIIQPFHLFKLRNKLRVYFVVVFNDADGLQSLSRLSVQVRWQQQYRLFRCCAVNHPIFITL